MKLMMASLSLSVLILSGCAHCPPETKADEMVILIHGFGRSNSALSDMAERLEQEGYDTYKVGYSSINREIDVIVDEVTQRINRIEKSEYKKVHFVGHSLGGLLVRTYLGENKVTNLGNAVILGSPNKGTPVVEHFRSRWWFGLVPAANAMSSNGSDFLSKLKKPDYPLGVIAGNLERPDMEFILKGSDDGLVPLESTKVEGMSDFVLINSGHSRLRTNESALQQIIHFLKFTEFKKDKRRVI